MRACGEHEGSREVVDGKILEGDRQRDILGLVHTWKAAERTWVAS